MRKLLLLIAIATFAFASTINVPVDHATIQDAIDAATTVDGDIIQISAGTYTEALTVGKSLTFIGSGPISNPTTIITSTASKVIQLTVTGKSFTFQNLIVEGIDTNLGIYAGSSIDINSLTMQDVIARNFKVALYLSEKYPNTTTVNNLSMDNVTLTHNKFIGAYIGKTVLSGIVTNCTVTDNGYSDELPDSWQKTGLQFVNFDDASVPHVVVTNSTFSNNGAGASNIERTGLIIYTAYNALSTSEIMTVSGCSFSNHPLYAVRIKNGYNVGNTATVNGTFSSNYLDIWFNNIIGTTSSTTLVRNTFNGIKTVGAGSTYDYNTIQEAIDASSDGGTVNVAAGTYYEDSILIDKPVTITGIPGTCGPDASAPVLDGSGALANGFEIAPGVDNVIIEGFFIRNFDSPGNGEGCGVWAYGTSADPTTNITVRHNQFDNCAYSGVFFFNEGHSIFDNINVNCNIVNDTDMYGIELTNCENSIISNNQVTGGSTGLLITARAERGIPVEVNNISIIGNNITGSTYWTGNIGIVSFPDGTIENVTISGNTIADGSYGSGWGGGIVAYNYGGNFAGSFNVNNNSITGNTDNGIYNGTGILWDATCNWWGDASGPTHATNLGSGDEVTDNVTFLPWLVTSDLGGSCAGGTLLYGDKLGVRNDLVGLLPSVDKKTYKILEKAIGHLEKSLADELWEGNDRLSSKGIKVFEEEKKAVHELMKVKNLAVSGSITTLVEVDKMLAQTAINEAENDKDKEKAEVEMGKALDEIGKGNFDKAVEHYKQAWHQATKALKNLAKSFANSDVEEGSELVDSTIPEVFRLGENYPNPFNPTTLISYDLPEASQVSMTVYDMMGRQVKSLVQEYQSAGNHSVIWNATNDNGDLMSGGMYFYQIRAGSFQQTHKMILMK